MSDVHVREPLSEKLHSTKVMMCLLLFIVSTVFASIKLMDMELWVEFNKWNFGILAVGNVATKGVRAFQNKK